MKGRALFWSVLAAVVLLLGGVTLASSPAVTRQVRLAAQSPSLAPLGTAFSYQGYLEDGGAAANGVYDFQFMLYDASSGGSQVGSTVYKDDVTVTDGIFTVQLDFGDLFDGTALWLEVGVRDGASTGAYTTLLPRHTLTPAPQALYASHAPWSGLNGVPAGFADNLDDDALSSLSCGTLQVAKWNGANWVCAGDDDTTYTAGSGLTLSGGQFSVSFAGTGSATTAARSDHDHFGETWSSADQWGLKIENTDTNGQGVYGYASDTAGSNYGVYGQSDSTAGYGVYGYGSATSGTNYGVYGQSDSSTGYGVYGYSSSTAGTNYGVYGESEGFSGRGVYGHAAATLGINYGLYGRSESSSGRGVYGFGKYGVYGESDNASGYGLYGYASDTSGTNYGVYGVTDSLNGFGGYFLRTAAGIGSGAALYADGSIWPDVVLGGSSGRIVTEAGATLSMESGNDVEISIEASNSGTQQFEVTDGTTSLFTVDESGNMTATGTKSAVVQTASKGKRLLYAIESPEVWFEDFGSAKLSNGLAVISIDPLFAETVNLSVDYHVFLTPVDGWAGLYVANKTATSFEVRAEHGDLELTFDFRIVAKRLGYEDVRLEQPLSAEEQIDE